MLEPKELLPCVLAASKLVSEAPITLTVGEGKSIFDHILYLRRTTVELREYGQDRDTELAKCEDVLYHTRELLAQHAEVELVRAFELVYAALAGQPLPANVTVVDVRERLKALVEYDDSELWKQPPKLVSVTGIVTFTTEVRPKAGQTVRQAVERVGIQLRTTDGLMQTVTIDDVQEL